MFQHESSAESSQESDQGMNHRLQDIIDIDHFQVLQDRLNAIYSFPSSIIDNDGNILTATAWQDICTKFHRQNKECERECIKSDQYILSHLHEANPAVSYRCPHGLVDNATPIIIEGVHYGNFFTGQFFLEPPDLEFFRGQAKKYGFDEESYLEAVKKVPVWSQEQLNNYLFFIKGLIAIISESGLKNLHDIESRRQIEESIKQSDTILQTAMDGFWIVDGNGSIQRVNDIYCLMSGYTAGELLSMHISDVEVIETVTDIQARIKKIFSHGEDRFESRHRRKNGTEFDVEVSVKYLPENGGQYFCFIRDITEKKEADISLENFANKMESIFRAAPVGIGVVSNRVFMEANDVFCDMVGYTLNELVGNSSRIVYPTDEEYEKVGKVKYLQIKERGTGTVETRMVRKDGSLIDVLLSSTPLDPTDYSVGVTFTALDITERKKAARALQESSERLSMAIEGAHIGFWDWDATTDTVIYSNVYASLLGYDAHEIDHTFEFWASRIHPDDKVETLTLLEDHLYKEKGMFNKEHRLKTKAGEWLWVQGIGTVKERDETGKPLRVSGIMIDINERKEAEKALIESEELFRSLVEQAADGFELLTIDGTYLDVNTATCDMLGYAYEEIVGKHITDIDQSDQARRFKKTVEQMGVGTKIMLETIHTREDGTHIPVEIIAKKVIIKGVPRILSMVRDISERKRALQEQEKLEEQLRQAQKMEAVGRLAGGVAHDFNNMLNVILGNTELIMSGLDPENPMYEDLHEIHIATERSANLTRQLLAFARKQTIKPHVLNLNETIAGMLKMLRRLIGENIELKWMPGNDIWSVEMDPSQIDQILANLCVNSRDAITDVGEIVISTNNFISAQSFCDDNPGACLGEYVKITVADNGKGMDNKTLENAFEPFYTTKSIEQGTGLGLATVYGIVKQNNGFILISSELNNGTTIELFIPRYIGRSHSSETTTVHSSEPGHETVLLVEDEKSLLRLGERTLTQFGYTVLAAASPVEAIQTASEHAGTIHLLITDVVMPDMNGRDMAKHIVSLHPDIQCLFMSGYTADVIADRGILDENVHFIQKPYTRQILAAKIHEILHGDR